MKTTAGDIDVELWSREAPLACRNFVQLCMEGYYNGTIFHRVIKQFIAQGGDPHGDGTGGESIYGKPFKDEFHTRLRFCRRGLVAMANSGRDDNGSQFFITLGETQELQNKHTIFGKISGATIYNVLKMEEGDIDANERPVYPYKINKTEVLLNPFDDIVPRKSTKNEKDSDKKRSKKEKGVKYVNINFKRFKTLFTIFEHFFFFFTEISDYYHLAKKLKRMKLKQLILYRKMLANLNRYMM